MSKFMQLRQAVFTRKLIASSTYIRKKERPQINNLCFHLKELDKGKQNKSQIIGEINKI